MKSRIMSKRALIINGTLALVMVAALGIFIAAGPGRAHAAPGPRTYHAKAAAHLRHNLTPLARNSPNGTFKKTGGNEDDSDTIDSTPTLSALCQSYIGGVNPYANPAPNVDQIVGDTTVGVGSQTGCQAAQNETTIATNPFNSANSVAGANDYRLFNTREGRNDGSGWAYATFNGGKTWKNVVLPGLTFQTGATGALSDMDSAGDPAIAFGPLNTVYYANLVFSRLNAASGITMSVSHDGGKTWAAPSTIYLDGVDAAGNPLPTNFFNDKEWVTADPFSGRVYVSWTHFTFDSAGNYLESPILVSASKDFGKTWSAPTQASPATATFTTGITSFGTGSIPQVGNHGELYVAYETAVCQTLACDQATDHDAVVVAKSTNGGKTFTNTEAATDFDFPGNPDTGRSTLTGENFRINSFPQMAFDRLTGRLYITWADDRNGQYNSSGQSIKTNGDAFVISSNNGTKWTQPAQIGTSADEVFPAVAAFAGRVVVTFYTRAYDPTGINLDYAYAKSGVTDDDNGSGLRNMAQKSIHRITKQSENPQVQFVGIGAVTGKTLQGVFIGDYTAVSIGADLTFHPCWTDFRGNPGVNTPNQDAYTQAISAFGDE